VRTFHLNRVEDETGVSGTGIVAQGVVFDDGTCVLRWLTENRSTTIFESLATLEAIHGHGGKTHIVLTPISKHSPAPVTKGRAQTLARNAVSREAVIAKVDKEKKVVYGVVLDPYIIDAHDDWVPPNEVEETAHNWLAASRKMKTEHETELDAVPVESYVMPYPTPEDYRAAVACEPHRVWRMKFGTEYVHSGAWVLGTRVLDSAAWASVLSGELGAYSIGGFGMRREMERVPMPEVEVLTIEAP
jgi:hypothetical protein